MIKQYDLRREDNQNCSQQDPDVCRRNSADVNWVTMASEPPTVIEPRLENVPLWHASRHRRVPAALDT
jgi:hypothetical protein